tara:strand:- start:311 stop:1669 length:1359 start_codon:yes stop_codon:yes gene_type:complete
MIEGAPVNVKDYGAVGDGVTDDTVAIQAADSFGGFTFPNGTYLIASNITIASDVEFQAGAKISVPTGVTVTFSKSISAGNLQEIFSGLGSVVVSNRTYPFHWFDTVAQAMRSAVSLDTLLIYKKISFSGADITKKLNFWGVGREYIEITGSHTLTGNGGTSTFNNLHFKTPSSGTVLVTVSGVGGANYRDCQLNPGAGNFMFDWDRDGTTPQIFELMQTKFISGKLCKTTSSGSANTFSFHVKESSLFSFTEANTLEPDNAVGDYISIALYNTLININDPQIGSNSKIQLRILAASTVDDNTADAAWRDNNGLGFDTLDISSNVIHSFNAVGRYISEAPFYAGNGVSATQTNWQTVPSVNLLTFDADLFDEVFYEGTATPLVFVQSWVMKAGAGKYKGQRFKLYIVGSIDTQGNTVVIFGRSFAPTSQEMKGLSVEGVFDGTNWTYSYSSIV